MSRQKDYTIEVREGKGRWVYLPVGTGLYRRCHISAMFVDCPKENCEASAKEPCYNIDKYLKYDVAVHQSPVHKERRVAYRKFLNDQRAVDDQGRVLKVVKGKKRA